MAGYGRKSKSGGFSGNLVKLGGAKRKLKIAGDMRAEHQSGPAYKKGVKQAHKKA